MSIEQAHHCATNAIGTGPQVSKITQNVMCYTLLIAEESDHKRTT